ncbi:hypothetical protein B0H13DRAFT_2357876 [Mycena leptocephala]|nr:hypothetical protein B0H13DRAFT_2357876 [Mycena leptocephala]
MALSQNGSNNGGSNGGKPGEHIRLPSVRLLFPPTTHLILSTMPAIILPPSSPSTPTCATDTLLDLVQQMMQQASRRPAQSMYSLHRNLQSRANDVREDISSFKRRITDLENQSATTASPRKQRKRLNRAAHADESIVNPQTIKDRVREEALFLVDTDVFTVDEDKNFDPIDVHLQQEENPGPAPPNYSFSVSFPWFMRPATSLTSSPMRRSSLSLPPAVHQLPTHVPPFFAVSPAPPFNNVVSRVSQAPWSCFLAPSQIGPPHPRRINQSRQGPQGTIIVIVECVSSLKQGWIVL